MFPEMRKQANLPGIAAGAPCGLPLPPIGVHHGLYLMCRKAAGVPMTRAEIIADVGTITLRLRGEPKIEATATVLLDLFKYWFDSQGAHTVAGLIPIPFWRPNLQSAAEKALISWGMDDVKSYTIEVDIVAVATLVTIEIWCEIENRIAPLGRHLCIGYHPQTFAATGVQDIITLPHGDADAGILAMHIGESTGDINALTVKANGIDIIDEVSMEMNNHALKKAGRTGQTDYYHADFSVINDRTGYLESGPLKSWRVQPEWELAGGAPGNYPIHIEEYRGLASPPA